jgi:hypothetical protein
MKTNHMGWRGDAVAIQLLSKALHHRSPRLICDAAGLKIWKSASSRWKAMRMLKAAPPPLLRNLCSLGRQPRWRRRPPRGPARRSNARRFAGLRWRLCVG